MESAQINWLALGVPLRTFNRAQPEPETPSIAPNGEFVHKEDHEMGAPRLDVEIVGEGRNLVLLARELER